jgi:multiple sugar transport system substrate-binding protein
LCSTQLYYNQDLFDKAGMPYPNENWTWDDFLAAAQKLTIKQGDETTQWGTDLGYLGGWDGGWQMLMWTRGGKVQDTNFNPDKLYLDAPEVIDALQWLQDLIYKHKVAPPPAVVSALQQAGGPFLSGKVAMVVDGCWMLSAYKGGSFKLGMTVIPKGPAGRFNPIWYAMTFVIPEASKNKPLAWEWARWLAVDQKANELQASTGQSCGAPIVRKYDDLYSAAWKDVPGGDACVKSLENTKFGQIYTPKWQEIWDTIIAPEWDKFMNGTVSAKDFSAAINDKVNQKLQEK